MVTHSQQGAQQGGRLSTGIAGLDVILDGGLLRGRFYLLLGAPGTGKTVLANQLCFAQLASGGRAVYITLLAEGHSQMFRNLDTLTFFDRTAIGNTIHYFSGQSALQDKGLSGLLVLLRQVILQHKPSILVLDTLITAEAMIGSDTDFRHFISALSMVAEIENCTILALSAPTPDTLVHPKMMVDGIIELVFSAAGRRTLREIEVLKFRASGYLEGRHSLYITPMGMQVYPRTEAHMGTSAEVLPEQRTTLAFNIEQLDKMLHGGVLSASTTMLLGVPGSGKTFLGLSFLAAAAQRNEAGLYFGFYETPQRLIEKGDNIGLNLSQHVTEGTIEVQWCPPVEGRLDVLADRLLGAVQARQVRCLFIDGITGFQQAADYPDRLPHFFSALMNELRARGVTTVFSVEMSNLFGPDVKIPIQGTSILADNIFFLRYVELQSQLYRLVSILKVRERAYETAIREFRITEQGLQVAATFDSAQAILTGIAHPLSSPSENKSSAEGNPPQ
jgi:circadian clock protein KaiC